MRKGLDGEPVKLIDPNGRKRDNTVSLDFWSPDPQGRYVAYGLSEGGSEMATLRILDVETGKDLPEVISPCRYTIAQWLPDSSGFFYIRNPRLGTVPKGEETVHPKIYFHALGDDPEKDAMIFGEGRPKDDMLGLLISADGRWLAINVSHTWTENEVYLYDVTRRALRPIITGILSRSSLVFAGDVALVHTNYGANNYRILSVPIADLGKPLDEWNEVVPEREHLLESFSVTKEKILLRYLVDAATQLKVVDHAGNDLRDVPLPLYSSLSGIGSKVTESEFFYGAESYTFPPVIYHYDPARDAYREFRKIDNPIDPEQYEVKQEWFASKDGTRVPMFIFHKKGIALGATPTILYGYGGFGSNETPWFMRSWVPWVSHGGIFAVANIRGGAEFGEKWHLDGIKDKKQNGFDDFIEAAKHLIAARYTDPAHLGILGGSNGGLLVSAVAVQRPDLFRAACARVALTDMVRFPKFGMAMRWVHEYGDPSKPEDLASILRWSPYHNVHEGSNYPAMLFTTGEKDSRVDPLHSRKMAAAMQAAGSKNPVFIYTEVEAGHGAGKPISKIIDLQSLIIAFFAEMLQMQMG
jgi:prolyl oligopeptidase